MHYLEYGVLPVVLNVVVWGVIPLLWAVAKIGGGR